MMRSTVTRTLSVLLILAAAFEWGAAADADRISLFDGRTLNGWDGDPKYWSIQDNAITGINTEQDPLPASTYLIWRGGTFDDFELEFEFRIMGGNSGFHFRSRAVGKWQVQGYQADISDMEDYTGVFYEASDRSQLAYRGEEVVIDETGARTITRFGSHEQLRRAIKEGDWNRYRVRAIGDQIELRINDVVMSRGIDRQKDRAAASGIFAIQLHDGPPMKVQLRDIQLTRLSKR